MALKVSKLNKYNNSNIDQYLWDAEMPARTIFTWKHTASIFACEN